VIVPRIVSEAVYSALVAACLAAGLAVGLGTLPACDSPPKAQPEELTTLVLGGDVMFGRWRDDGWTSHHQLEALEKAGLLAGADFAAVNLETALCATEVARDAKLPDAHIQLTAPPTVAKDLADAGIDLVSIANNHALDCGSQSVEHTTGSLARHYIETAGRASAQPTKYTIENMQLQVFAATLAPPANVPGRLVDAPYVVSPTRFDDLVEQVERIRKTYEQDLLIVSLHWGREYASHPTPWQINRAHELVDAGADVVWGHGSHTVQRIERYEGAVVAYGLGNLHFDMRHPATRGRQVLVLGYTSGPNRRAILESAEMRALP
jgi:poly-gamma-glutamate synthesis protein (capsule biosynthesis protein)